LNNSIWEYGRFIFFFCIGIAFLVGGAFLAASPTVYLALFGVVLILAGAAVIAFSATMR